jgi:DNA-binding CsgD family transcriptional regulator
MKTETENKIILATLVVSALFASFDIISDFKDGESGAHLAVELGVTCLTLASIFLLGRRKKLLDIKLEHQTLAAQQAEILQKEAAAEAFKWREEASSLLKGLSDAIDLQFGRWQLSAAEKEVALLLLKGLSLKEIAEIRNVSEKTARAQSFSIYSKSGLSGRAQLSAFFLEDLMLPSALVHLPY